MSLQDDVVRLFGAMLIAVGALIILLSGGCTLAALGWVAVTAIQQPFGLGLLILSLLVVGVFGGIGLAIGLGLFSEGRSFRRWPRA